MDLQTAGVVLRAVDYKESDRILTVLTAQSGLMTVKSRGCRRKNSPLTAASEPFSYSQMTLYSHQDRFTLREASGLQQFWGLREDVVKLALASYFADVAQTVAVEGEPNQELLSLLLNCLYALDKLHKPLELVKAAFELRAMVAAGYAPLLDACAVCGVPDPEEPHLHLQAGVLHCAKCQKEVGEGKSVSLTPEMLAYARQVVYGDPKRILAYPFPTPQLPLLGSFATLFLTIQLEREFKTLDFYRQMEQTV